MAAILSLVLTLVAVALVAVVGKPLRGDLVGFLTGLAVVTITWSAVKPGGSPVSDLVLALGLIAAGPSVLRGAGSLRLPLGTGIGAVLIAVSVFLNCALPSDQGYAQTRYRVDPSVPTEAARIALNVLTGVKLLMALLVIPVLLLVVATDRARLRALLDLWVVSAVVSALAALVDSAHVLNLHGDLLGVPTAADGRQGGLTNHPVHLATVCVMVLPLVLTSMSAPGRRRRLGVLALLVLSAGIFETGSRTGILSALIALALSSLLLESVRRVAIPVSLPLLLLVTGYLLIDSSLLHAFLHKARLSGGEAAGSNFQRAHVAAQAVKDVAHRPLLGIGYDVAADGHSVYLEALAAGGVLGALGVLSAAVGGLSRLRARLLGRTDVLGLALGTSALMWLVLDVTENALVDRYMWLPVGFVLALASLRARQVADGTLDDDPTLLRAPQPSQHGRVPVGSAALAAAGRT
jgi:hypothetical protein